ncbi:MAG: hypothetical protein H5T63_04930, partial [Chloroflexi bacterium]|nr:hypothetical protein [Chloroflexota bacterium]
MQARRLIWDGRWVAFLLLAVLFIPLIIVVKPWPASAQSSFAPIQITNSDGDKFRHPTVKLVGWLNKVKPTLWTVGDHVVRVDPASPMAGAATSGVYAAIIARLDNEGQLCAENYFLQPQGETPWGTNMEFRCLIQEIDPRYWIVCNRMVLIAENTAIQGRPEIGALAEVKGIRLPADTVLARSIRVVVAGAYAEVEFEGAIESLADNMWIVNGITVAINA